MLRLGELLKSKRKEMELELSLISETTKIPVKLLEALEKGDYDKFSSEVYLQGFLKNYAKFLKIDTQKALAIYRRDRMDYKEETLKESKKPITEEKPVVTPGRIVLAFVILIVITVISFVAVQVNKILKPPYLELTEPLQGAAPSELFIEVGSETISLAGKVEVGSKLLINGNEVNTNNLQEFRVDNYNLNPGSNEIYIIAESYYFSKTSQIKLTVVSQVEEEEQNGPEQSGQEEETEEALLESMEIKMSVVNEDAWIVATVDGITKVNDTVQPGNEYTFTAKEEFTIYSPRPQMVNLFINGEQYSFSSQVTTSFKLVNGKVVQE